LAKNPTQDIHFVCIDKRKKLVDGTVKAVLEGNKEFIIPPNVSSVPSLLLLNRGYRILVGGPEIMDHLRPIVATNHKYSTPSDPNTWRLGERSSVGVVAAPPTDRMGRDGGRDGGRGGIRDITNESALPQQQIADIGGEPSAFGDWGGSGGSGGGMFGVVSDFYSFLDQTADSLLATGDGGMRQMHRYAAIDSMDSIETPPDTYAPDTIGEGVSVDALVQQRRDV
jgi:hypothetical protein